MNSEAEDSVVPATGIGGVFERGRTRAVFPGILAWSVTLMPIVISPSRTLGAKGLALASLATLLLGVASGEKRRALENIFLIWAFPLLAATAWCVVGVRSGAPDQLQCVLGGLSWAMFALAAISPVARKLPGDVPVGGAGTSRLQTCIAYGITLLAFAALLSLGGGFLTKERNTLRFVLGVVSALAVLSATDRVFEELHGARRAASPRSRRKRVATVGIAVAAVTGVGVALQVFLR